MIPAIVAVIPARVSNPCSHGVGLASVTFAYNPADAYAITMVIPRSGAEPAVWRFTRELLAIGMHTEAGIGAVSIHPGNPDRDELGIMLTGDDTQALIELPRLKVRRFLLRTFAAVCPGDEHLYQESLDDTITKLLDSAP